MKFFLEYLSHFNATDILRMYGEGAFRTSEEIKLVDFAINFKVIFHDDHISPEDLRIYKHLQLVVDAVRVHQARNESTNPANTDEFDRFCSSEEIHFNSFVIYSESEREVRRVNVLERKISFCFKPVQENLGVLLWLENALEELLSYVLRDSEEEDRVGVIIKYENSHERKAAFPIKLKNELKSTIVAGTVTSLLKMRGSLITGQRMNFQLIRIRLPLLYRQLTQADVMNISGEEGLC